MVSSLIGIGLSKVGINIATPLISGFVCAGIAIPNIPSVLEGNYTTVGLSIMIKMIMWFLLTFRLDRMVVRVMV